MAQFILRDLDWRFWNRVSTRAKMHGWPVQKLVIQLLEDWVEGRVSTSVAAPLPAADLSKGYVTLQFTCPKCNKAMEVDCGVSKGLSMMEFQTVECPLCHQITERALPGPQLDVRAAGPAGRRTKFEVGDRVHGKDTAPASFRGRVGQVVGVGPNPSEYQVHFDDGPIEHVNSWWFAKTTA